MNIHTWHVTLRLEKIKFYCVARYKIISQSSSNDSKETDFVCSFSHSRFVNVLLFVACHHEASGVLENVEIGSIEEGCSDEASKALEPLMNGTSSCIYQMVTNADGTVSLVGLGAGQLLHVPGDKMLHILHLVLLCMYVCMWIYIAQPLQPKQSRGASIG